MPIIDTDQDTVLRALVKLLQTKLSLDDRHCFETVTPLQEFGNPQSGDFWVTVSSGDGGYEEGQFQTGGGAAQVVEFGEATVMGFSRIRLDGTDRDTKLLHDLRRGLYGIKKKLLGALVGEQLIDDQGNELLRSLIVAKRAVKPDYAPKEATGWIGVVFSTDFDWNLTTAPS